LKFIFKEEIMLNKNIIISFFIGVCGLSSLLFDQLTFQIEKKIIDTDIKKTKNLNLLNVKKTLLLELDKRENNLKYALEKAIDDYFKFIFFSKNANNGKPRIKNDYYSLRVNKDKNITAESLQKQVENNSTWYLRRVKRLDYHLISESLEDKENLDLLKALYNNLLSSIPIHIMSNKYYITKNIEQDLNKMNEFYTDLLIRVRNQEKVYNNMSAQKQNNTTLNYNNFWKRDIICLFSKKCLDFINKFLNKKTNVMPLNQVEKESMAKAKTFSIFETPELFKNTDIIRMLNIKNFYIISSNILLGEIIEKQRAIKNNKEAQNLNLFRQFSILLSFILNIFSLVGLLVFFKINLNMEKGNI